MSKRQAKTSYWQDAPMPRDQLVLFDQTLEERIPEGHPVRILDEILSQMDWTDWEAEYHGSFGQPPIHPSVLAKVLLFATIRRIRSSRRIEYNLIHSIDFIWLASGRLIDHSTLCEFRRKHPEQLKGLFRQMVNLALDLGVAKLAEVCIDGTRVRANASRFNTLTAEKVEELLKELDQQIAEALLEMETNDTFDELFDDGQPADQLPAELQEKKVRQALLEEKLAQLREMDAQRKQDGIDPKKNPAQLPAADGDSRVLPNKEGGYAPNYTPMAMNETLNGFIVNADVLIGNAEQTVMTAMVDQSQEAYGQTIDTVLGDGLFSSGTNLVDMEARGIELLSPLTNPEPEDNPAVREDPSQPVAEEDVQRLPINPRTKRFGKPAFIYDEKEDCYWCPAGEKLTREGAEKRKRAGETIELTSYRCPRGSKCGQCKYKALCQIKPDGKRGRKVTRDGFEEIRRRHSERMQQAEVKERYKQRLHFGETPFAVLKAVFDLRRFLLRGIENVQQEWLWGCTAFNTWKLMRLWGTLRAKPAESQVAAEG
jgi:transposase